MKDFDLESKIKALRVPERDADYWEQFPQHVVGELRATPAYRPAPPAFGSWFLWGTRMALTCLVLGFCLWQSRVPKALSHALLTDERKLCQSVERFHDNLGRLMEDEHGLHRLIEDPQ